MIHERLLQRMQPRPVLQALQCFDAAAFDCRRQRQAGEMRGAVNQHRAGAAAALPAAEFRRVIAELLAQRDEQIGAGVDKQRDVAAVVTKLQRDLHRPSPFSNRRNCTGAASRRYQALASASSTGASPSSATFAAAAMVCASSGRPSSARSALLARKGVAPIAPKAMRAPATRPPLNGRCAAMLSTEAPFGFTRAIFK